ncbi:MAG: glycosyltransferase [Deltaproteobacteria bacterium]|nr:glycosyltransferase [Nannocystaceae bacterium]
MARILIATVPIAGHIGPFLPIARRLAARGHEVRWYTHEKYRARIEATGAGLVAARSACRYDDSDLPGSFAARPARAGIRQLAFDIKHVFIDDAPGQVHDLAQIAVDFHPDVVLCDAAFVGGGMYRELSHTPQVVLGVVPLSLGGDDVAPFGLGIAPSASLLGRLRNRMLHWVVQHVVFRDVQQHWQQTRARVGLPAAGWVLDASAHGSLYLQPTVPGFEYPRRALPGSVRFIGALPVEAPREWTPPPWWAELDGGRPVVHVTQGTIANDRPLLFAPALEGLANDDVLVVISTGGKPPASLGLSELPANARVGTFLSYPELLPKTAAMITNGGYGGVQAGLQHGVPIAVAGTSEDKPEVAARVAWSGGGIDLRTASPSPTAVRDAVRALLHTPRYRERARELAREYAEHDAITRAVEHIETLLGDVERRPLAVVGL